ncbi:MAG: flavodoxin family protein [Oscillospiraceae bacterium]|jgi:multimeric flavodoxin WrbA|nr:flavodoxin family protein [Oscillospiraceae bacterium]
MKVLLINGSPHEQGCTYTALSEIGKTLSEAGVDWEIFQTGTEAIRGCMACGACSNLNDRCVFDDAVNRALEKAETADGFVFGSPVHYASASGNMTSFMDRFFYAGPGFAGKPGAVVVSCRRGGAASAFDQLNKYLTISGMPVVSSQYWNSVHGNSPDEVRKDLEGLQVMRALGRNMAWLLKCIEAGRNAGIGYPQGEKRVWTNFIR